MPMNESSRQTVYRLAGEADVDARTAAQVLEGKPVHSATLRVVEEAAKKLGIKLPTPSTAGVE